MGRIKVHIDKTGKVKLDFIGFRGKSCFNESDKLKEILAKYGLTLKEGRIIELKQEDSLKVENNEEGEIIL